MQSSDISFLFTLCYLVTVVVVVIDDVFTFVFLRVVGCWMVNCVLHSCFCVVFVALPAQTVC